ncbi:MAG: radical SAM protein [Planctomycetota bacterium]|nr:radical SAM protein [Planctomycetota bacterium]
MKIVLVNPPSPPEYRVSRGLMGGFGMAVNPELLYPPIELAHVAGLLEEQGHEVVIFDGDGVDADVAAARKAIVAEAPAFVLLDSSSTSLTQDLGLAGDVRSDLGVPVFMLGSQVTYTPDDLFQNSSIDGVIRGEPEHTVSEVAARIAGGSTTFEDITGVTWVDGEGVVHQEPERDKINDLDALPIPSRHLLNNSVYKFPGLDGPVTTVKSSRGCPLNCSFCGYTLAQGLRFRFRSPEHVVKELVDLNKNHGLKYVVFRDPIFTTRKDRVMDICDGILREGLDIEWQCETAVKTLSPELLEKMAEAGCTHISLGIESGNAEIQKKHCGNKLNKLDQAKEVFEVCRRVGIETRAFCMIGFPEETPEMADETIKLVEWLDPDQVQFCAVTAYPGTPLYEMLSGTRDFDFATMTGHHATEGNEHMTAAEIEAKIRQAYRSFYRRPKRLIGELKHPRRFAGKVARYFRLWGKGA